MKEFLRVILLLVLVVGAVGSCTKREGVIYNGCKGSWVFIQEGTKILVDRLDYGSTVGISASWFVNDGRSSRVILVAVGRSIATGKPMGATSKDYYITGGYGGPTSASSLDDWNITSLFDSAFNNGCEG